MTREKTFLSVYGVEQPKQVLGLFTEDVKQVKRLAKTKQYQGLLELVLKYSYAIFYDYKTVSIRNNRLKYRKIAMSELSKKDVVKAFDMIAIATEPLEQKQTATKKDTPTDCVAIDQIRRLKDQLDNETYQLKRGQKADDTEIYIKVALVAMATGSRLQEIMGTLELSQRKGTITFTIDEDSTEGVILELDYKTVRAYLKDIRKHYADRIEANVDISTGIRKAVKRLEVPNCGNLNHLNALYKECIG
jgi:hypothetical protein